MTFLAAVAGVCLFASAATAGATTRIGETFEPNPAIGGGGRTTLQSGSPGGQYTVPVDGVITSWSFQAAANPAGVPQLTFKVARFASGTSFSIVAEDGPRTPMVGTLNTFPTQIPVRAGDVIGFYQPVGGFIYSPTGIGYSTQALSSDVAPGTTADFGAPMDGFKLDLSASLEPTVIVTGKRAAALKKCKKKHSRKARKKCRKRARKRPV